MKYINKFENVICLLLRAAIGTILICLVGINVLQIITRYFVEVVITWVEDVSILGILWIAVLGVPYAWFKGSHLEMDITDRLYPQWLKTGFWWGCQAVCLAASVKLAQLGLYNMRLNKGVVATALGYDESFRYLPLVVCGCLLGLAAATKMAEKACLIAAKKREAQP